MILDSPVLSDLINAVILLLPLIAGLTLVIVAKANLRIFQGLYIFLGASGFLIYYFTELLSYYSLLISLVVGELVFIFVLGVLGERLSTKSYATILFTIGLFPWSFNVAGSILFVLVSFIVILFYGHYKNLKAFKYLGLKFSNPIKAVSVMSEEDSKVFKSKASVIISKPILFSIVLYLCFVVIS